MVVLVHCVDGYQAMNLPHVYLLFAIKRHILICNYIFFALSGYFAFRIFTNVKSYFKNILRIYVNLFVPVITILFAKILLKIARGGGNLAIFELSGSWWFVFALFPLLIFAPFISIIIKNISNNLIICIIGSIIALRIYLVIVNEYLPNTFISKVNFILPEINFTFPLLCFILGMSLNKDGFSKNLLHPFSIVFTCVGLVTVQIAYFTNPRLLSPTSGEGMTELYIFPSVIFIILISKLKFKNIFHNKIIELIARCSFGIYLIHFTILGFADKFYKYFDNHFHSYLNQYSAILVTLLPTVVVFCSALILSILFNKLIIFRTQNKLKELIKNIR